MKKLIPLLSLFLLSLILSSCKPPPGPAASWHHPLYLGHNDFWKQRIPFVIRNNTELNLAGDPLKIAVGKASNQVPLKGVMAEALRVTNQEGTQMLYRLNGPDGKQIEEGPIPNGAFLTIPAQCQAGAEVAYYIYYDNASAWPVGEYFYTNREVSNGSFELSGEFGPLNWELDWPEDNRDIIWTDSESHSGSHSLEITADQAGGRGSYGASQTDFHLVPGATYKIEAWFKTDNLEGGAGFIMRPSNLARDKRALRFDPIRLEAPSGTNDWEKVSLEFTAPEESNELSMTTYMEGTGNLWIDDVRISCDQEFDIQTETFARERTSVAESGSTDQWYGGTNNNPYEWPLRASITVPNFSENTLEELPVYVDIQQLFHRLYADVDENSLMQVCNGTDPVPYLKMGNAILFKQDIPASTVQTFYLYFSDREKAGSMEKPETYSELSQVTENRISNSGFEEAEISGWERFGEGDLNKIGLDEEEGNQLLRLSFNGETRPQLPVPDVVASDPESGVGVYQIYDVEPGSTYLFSARAKSSNILDRTLTIRARFLDEAGNITRNQETLQANPDMHTNYQWVQYTMVIQTPERSNSVRVELLSTIKGDVWYDDVYFMKVGHGTTGAMALERKAAEDLSELAFWQQNPIVKVFQDDLPKGKSEKLTLSAARNEVEPLQVAFRSPVEYKDLEIRVSPLTDPSGNKLEDIEIGVVGYVPVSYPSNFIRDFEKKFWQTKVPFGDLGSDGWTGWFPDPILPFQTFDLPADITTTAWIEIAVPEDAAPGDYTGNVSLVQGGKKLKEIPLEMKVYSFVLPEASDVATFDLRFRDREMFGRKYTEQEMNEEIWHYYKKHRIRPETIRPQPEFKVEDGEVSVDFTEFDKAANKYFNEMKFSATYSPWDFYLFGWGRPPSVKFGEKPYPGEYPYEGADRSKLRPEFVKVYQSALRQYWEHMKEKGWEDRVIMYISDEPYADNNMILQTKVVCDMIHEVDPEIPIYISTWWYRPEFEGYVNMWGVSHRGGGWGHSVPPEDLETILKNGGHIIFTTDGMVCHDTPYIGFERLIPYFCFKYGATEYENWASSWHTLDPYRYGWHTWHRQSPSEEERYWMRYPNGAGQMIYPGPPIGLDHLVASTKLKILREGVEDYEYMKMLDRLISEGKAAGEDTQGAVSALDAARDLVVTPCADGRYTTGYVSDPDAILKARNGMAIAIQELAGQKE